jgi:phosphoribosylaminoimidazolecarboxamide formyltransferase/IMP cyclohydrolase
MGKISRALISVSNKSGLVEFARRLAAHSVELVSTGGTANALRDAGLKVRDVSDLTGFPEILGGRVKTLHPKVHGGILAIRDREDHQSQVAASGIEYIDMVVANLYPFRETIIQQDVAVEAAIENIDIGGPSMLRSAAKNLQDVVVIIDPDDYSAVADELDVHGGEVTLKTRLRLAGKAFESTARYDAAIAGFFADSLVVKSEPENPSVQGHSAEALGLRRSTELPKLFSLFADKEMDLRYGENPHQRAALYQLDPSRRGALAGNKLQGKELSFNNLIDLDAAWSLVSEFPDVACAIIKHTNPCGAATGETVVEAFTKARASDPVSAYGGIIGFNQAVTEDGARVIVETFFEAIIAPEYEAGALSVLASKKNLRVLKTDQRGIEGSGFDIRMVGEGGLLVQDRDRGSVTASDLKVVSRRPPTEQELRALLFSWIIVKHVKSNAIVYARDGQLVGVGAGQMSRVDSVKIGAMKATLQVSGTVMASDAFFPFRDGIDEAARAGITAVIQPGGSVRDGEVIAAADEHNLAMAFTGMRHFKH